MKNFLERFLHLIDDVSGGNVSDFAKKSGINRPTLHKYTKGRLPSIESLFCIRNNLGVDINWLLTGEGEPYAKAGADESVPQQNGEVVDFEHIDIIKTFKDRPRARRMNYNLSDIERLSPQVFEKMDEHIAYTAETVRLTAGEHMPEDVQKKKVNGQ